MVYRQRKGGLDPEWHFHSDCPHWPALGSIQVRFLKPDQDDRVCTDCIKLESDIFPRTTSVGSVQGVTSISRKRDPE